MDCNETRRLLDAHVDEELDLIHHLEVEAHLRDCSACRAMAENARLGRVALRGSLPRFTASAQLVERIRTALPATSRPVAKQPRNFIFPIWRVSGLAAVLAGGIFVGALWNGTRIRSEVLVDEAVAGHVRSLQADHLADVVSTDRHTVKPWFAGKLDFSPPVVDLADMGFPLTGGRLDRMNARNAAALVFRRRQHVINLFIWPGAGTAVASRVIQRDGYNAQAWSRSGLNFLAISEIPPVELAEFAEAFRTRIETGR